MERLRKKKTSGVKVRKKNGQKFDNSSPGSDVTRRQRLDLKGPRVKHVCRSASIVLGQPQATFPLDKKLEKTQQKQVQGKNGMDYCVSRIILIHLIINVLEKYRKLFLFLHGYHNHENV